VWAWCKLAMRNRRAIRRVVKDCFTCWHGTKVAAGSPAEDVTLPLPLGDRVEESAGAD
jgi:hypothetical protein